MKEKLENEYQAAGAAFLVANNQPGSFSIQVDGSDLITEGVDMSIYKSLDNWQYIEAFGVFDKLQELLLSVEADFNSAEDKAAFIQATKEKIGELLEIIE